jgi:pyruvate/2-oxoacid:ferredoxin oxidoreductase beta subunit
MFERNDDVLFICYDNEAHMNTGVQRSGATPPAARTATTPAVGPEPRNIFGQGKNAPLIAMAHQIPYVATATVAGLRDLEYRARRAMSFRAARYLHMLVPCPLGWGSASQRRKDNQRRHHCEFRYGMFTWSFALPANADDSHIQAIYSHGILEVTIGLQQQAAQQARRHIQVMADHYIKPT